MRTRQSQLDSRPETRRSNHAWDRSPEQVVADVKSGILKVSAPPPGYYLDESATRGSQLQTQKK